MTTAATAFIANSLVLDLIGLRSHVEETFINNATVTVTVKDKAGTDVLGATWPLSMAYVAASDGDYRAILPSTLEMLKNKIYTAFIDADGGGERIGHWEFAVTAVIRTGQEV